MMSTAVKRRWVPRVRFSLLTLVLGVLLAGSGGTLWWNWGPWEVAFTVNEAGKIRDVFFSDDDELVLIHYNAVEGTPPMQNNCVDVREAATGRQRALLKNPGGEHRVLIRGNYAWLTDAGPTGRIFNYRTGEMINSNRLPCTWLDFDEHHILTHHRDGEQKLFKLPNLELVATFHEKRRANQNRSFDDDGIKLTRGRILIQRDQHFEIHDLKTGNVVTTPALDNRQTYMTYHCEKTLIVMAGVQGAVPNPLMIDVFDLQTGAHLSSVPGFVHDFSPDGTKLGVERDAEREIVDAYSGKAISEKFRREDSPSEFSRDNSLCMHRGSCSMYDGLTFKKLWQLQNHFGHLSPNGGVVHVTDTESKCMGLVDARSGRTLLNFSSLRWRRELQPVMRVEFAHDSAGFAARLEEKASVFRQTRPVGASGVFYRVEFWLTVGFGVGLLWSIFKRRLA